MTSTHAQLAYQHLRSRLIAGDFQPGSRLRYGPIGQELGISATPVREAIGLLANEGLVELVPQLGAVVRTIGRSELIELYEMREAIEPYAAEKAAERASESQVAAIRRAFEKMDTISQRIAATKSGAVSDRNRDEFEKADLAFHMLVIQATGNQTMVRSGESSNALMRVFSTDRHGYDQSIMHSTCRDHESILSAIANRKPRQASRFMREHIRSGLELTLESLDLENNHKWETK